MSEILRGVTLTRVDRKHLMTVVKKLNLSTDTSIDSMVVTLADHLIRLHKPNPVELLDCNFCGGPSDATFDLCPYCGLSEEGADKAKAKADAEEKAKPPAEDVKAPKEKKPRSSAKEKPEASAPPAPPVKPAKPPKEPKPEKAAGPGVKKAKTDALAPVVHQGEIVTAKELDDKVAEFKKVQVDIVGNHWNLGRLLGETHNLYKLRTDDKGAQKYKNWGQFVSSELDITPAYAYDLVGVSLAFTEEDIRLVGVTKLRVLARIPDEAKKKNLLERAKAELNGKPALTRNQLEAEAKKDGPLPNRQGLGGGSVGGEDAAKKRAEKAAERAKNKGVTVVIQPGRISIPLYNAKLSKKAPVRAFDLSDEPYGVEGMLNGIKVRYVISKEQDGLVLTVERVREEERITSE